MPRSLGSLLLCLTAGLTLVPVARANTISGVAFCNLSNTDASHTPAPGATHSGTACATFTASALNFYSNGSSSTNNLGSFLNYYGLIVGGVNYLNGFTASSSMDNSFFEFTGTAYFTQGQTYNTYHDDGTVMNVDGNTVVNSPGTTGRINTTFVFNEASGNYNFDYDYTEKGGISAYGTDADVTPTPEPGTLLLLATGAAFLFLVARRRRNSSVGRFAS